MYLAELTEPCDARTETRQENHLGMLLYSLPDWPRLPSEVVFGPGSGTVHWMIDVDTRF